MRRIAILLGPAAVVLTMARPCAALTVRYRAPAACPTVEVLRGAVSQGLVGHPMEGPETLEVQVAADTRSAVVRLFDAGGRPLGERTVASDAGDCAALVRAAGLSAGLALGPLRSTPPAPMAPEPSAAAASASEAPDVALEWGGTWGAGGALGLHPGAALAIDGGARVADGPWSGQLELRASAAPAWVDGAVGDGRVGSVGLALGVWGCRDLAATGLCLGALGGGELHAGLDFARSEWTAGPWLAGAGRVEWRLFGGWGPRLEIIAPLSRLTLTVDGVAAWTTPAVAGALGLGGRW